MKIYDINDLRRFAVDNGFECLSDKYINCNYKYRWRCMNGHEYDLSWWQIKRRKNKGWCFKCCLDERLKNFLIVGRFKGWDLVSSKYLGILRRYTFKCSYGHIFDCTLRSANGYSICPVCKYLMEYYADMYGQLYSMDDLLTGDFLIYSF